MGNRAPCKPFRWGPAHNKPELRASVQRSFYPNVPTLGMILVVFEHGLPQGGPGLNSVCLSTAGGLQGNQVPRQRHMPPTSRAPMAAALGSGGVPRGLTLPLPPSQGHLSTGLLASAHPGVWTDGCHTSWEALCCGRHTWRHCWGVGPLHPISQLPPISGRQGRREGSFVRSGQASWRKGSTGPQGHRQGMAGKGR